MVEEGVHKRFVLEVQLMLKITLKFSRSIINDADGYFDNVIGKLKNDRLTKYLLKHIDDAELISESIIKSNKNGKMIPVQCLSTGCKIALVALYTKEIVNFVEAGDNVFKALLEISRLTDKDINIYVNNDIICKSDINVFVDGIIMTARKFATDLT